MNRLHAILIEDTRFIRAGLRPDGVFLGERDRDGGPLPEFIGARPDDLTDLVSGMLTSNERMRQGGIDPVLQASATAFGFVYIHPYQDGNGRLHRCLIHHVLAERKFTPPGVVFPVSSVMLDRIGPDESYIDDRKQAGKLSRGCSGKPLRNAGTRRQIRLRSRHRATTEQGSAMTRAPTCLPILALAAVVAACAPPAGYTNPDIQADYTIGNHLFDVRAVQSAGGYNVYVAELGGPYLTDFVTLDRATHIEAAEQVIRPRCAQASLDNNWQTFGLEPAPQPVLGIVARFSCS